MPSGTFTYYAKALAEGKIQYNTAQDGSADTFKVMLVTAAPSLNEVSRSAITNEVLNGNGYVTGGIVQPFTLLAVSTSLKQQAVDYTDIVAGWTNATFSAIGAIIYCDKGGAANDIPCHFIDFGTTVSCSDSNYSITYTNTFIIQAG